MLRTVFQIRPIWVALSSSSAWNRATSSRLASLKQGMTTNVSIMRSGLLNGLLR